MTDVMPSLNALRAFDAVAQAKSYKAAAENLRVTPAAVKQLVAKLEAHLGVPLIERQGQGLALTAAGEAGAGRLSEGFAALEQAVGMMVPSTQAQARLFISAEPFFAQSWLVPRLQHFRDANPGIDVLIDSSLEIKDLSRDGIDGAVRYGVPAQDPERTARLFGDAVMPLCSPQLLGRGAEDQQAALMGQTFLHWDLRPAPWAKETARWFDFEYFWSKAGLGPFEAKRNVYFSDYNLALQAALAGQGVVLGSLPILRGLVDQGMLVPALPVRLETDIGYDFVMSPSVLRQGMAERFRTWLLEEAGTLDMHPPP
jgi:LysR family transcriptional regulator, glycine cleavage system transcriptional activator